MHLGPGAQGDWHHRQFNFDPGNVELPVLLFFKQFPQYDNYWVVEYDVRFTGAWRDFFSSHDGNRADLLGTTLTRRTSSPDWYHWGSLDLPGKTVAPDDHIRGFFPIYRLSRRALVQLDKDYRDGANGHFECLIPTLLHHAGMTIEDIGGTGEFVHPANVNRFYRNTPSADSLGPGTFVFRPVLGVPGKERNMLWHPVRPAPFWQTLPRRKTGDILRFAGRVANRVGSAFRDIR